MTNSCLFLPKTIFQEAWWMETATTGEWGIATYKHKLGSLHWVYHVRNRFFCLKELGSPPLTIYLGLYFETDLFIQPQDQFKILAEGLPELLHQLPKYHRLRQNFTQYFNWWAPLFWKGFDQHTRYTSIITDIKDRDKIWDKFNKNTKRKISKSSKNIKIERCFDAKCLYRLFSKTMEHQAKQPGYSEVHLSRLTQLVKNKERGMIYKGVDDLGREHCALLCVWDKHQAYYLAGGTDPELRSSGAMSLAMWTAIQDASSYTDVFNFEGSMQIGIDNFLRGFGAIPIP